MNYRATYSIGSHHGVGFGYYFAVVRDSVLGEMQGPNRLTRLAAMADMLNLRNNTPVDYDHAGALKELFGRSTDLTDMQYTYYSILQGRVGKCQYAFQVPSKSGRSEGFFPCCLMDGHHGDHRYPDDDWRTWRTRSKWLSPEER